MMIQQRLKQFLVLIPLLFIAIGVSAYGGPSGAPTTNNTPGPVSIGPLNEVKNGGLSVTTFAARGDSLFGQDVYFGGQVVGGFPSATTSAIAIGDTTTAVATVVSGSLRAATAQSDTLSHSDTNVKPVCALADGTFVLCSAPPTACVINAFTSNKYSAKSGSAPLTFSWSTTGCTSVSLQGVPLATTSGSIQQAVPSQTTTYTLTASNTTSNDTASFTITIGAQVGAQGGTATINLALSQIPATIFSGSVDNPFAGYLKAYYGQVTLAPDFSNPTTPTGITPIVFEVCADVVSGFPALCLGGLSNGSVPTTVQVPYAAYNVQFNGACQGSNIQGSTPSLRYNNNGTPGNLVGNSLIISTPGPVNLLVQC
jgi:hypothetical protein